MVHPTERGKRLLPTIRLPRPWVKSLPTPNWTTLKIRRRRGVTIWVVSVLLSLTHGTTSISISPWYPVIICLCRWAACGFPFAIVTRRFLRPLWFPPFLTLIFTKELHYLCPCSSNLGQVLLWVGKNGWT